MSVCTRAESIRCHLKDTNQEAAGQSRVSLSFILHENGFRYVRTLRKAVSLPVMFHAPQTKTMSADQSKLVPFIHSNSGEGNEETGPNVRVTPAAAVADYDALPGPQTHRADCCLRLCVT